MFIATEPENPAVSQEGEFNLTLSQNGRPSPLDELYEYAKNKGTITYQEVTDRLGNTFFEADQLEKVLDKLLASLCGLCLLYTSPSPRDRG